MKLNRFASYAWGVMAWNLLVVLWGALVRASGSGAGCGSHWPLCNGEVLPRATQAQTVIEFTHRLMSGLALILIVGLVVWAFRAFPKEHAVRTGAVLSLIFILTEALIGAGLVLFKLVADNASMTRAVYMSVHLVNTFALLAVITLTAWWASGGPTVQLRGQGALGLILALALFGTLVLAVSGAVAALGDTLFPANSLAAGLRQDFSTTSHLLLRLRLLHPALALTVGVYAVLSAVLSNLLRPSLWVKRWAVVLIGLALLQLGAGLLNLFLLAPIWLQLVHLLLADLLWLALVLLATAALAHKTITEKGFETLDLRPAVEL